MAALIALATASVWPVTLTVAGPPRIFTAFLGSGTRLQDVYNKTGKPVNAWELAIY
jgi:hypothetical protein